MSDPPSGPDLRRELRAYYGPLLPVWDATLEDRGDLAFWRRRADAWTGRTVLELGCGTGRVTEVLAERVGRVVGLDLNLEALRRARRRLEGASSVSLVGGDMRSFALGRRFPVAVAANDPFSHLRSDEGRRRALERVAAHLEPGGRLVLDALWFSDDWLAAARTGEGRTLERRLGTAEGGGELRLRQSWRFGPSGRRCTARYELWREGERLEETTFRGRAWSIGELRRNTAEAGLGLTRLHGDYEGGRWHPGAERLIVEAERR